MYTLEYLYSKGRAGRHTFYDDIVDIYTIYKDGYKVPSEQWPDYFLALEIDNLNKAIYIKKMFFISVADVIRGYCYDCSLDDYADFRDELASFIDNVKTMLDILDYKVRIH
jgi:hypothetical protein